VVLHLPLDQLLLQLGVVLHQELLPDHLHLEIWLADLHLEHCRLWDQEEQLNNPNRSPRGSGQPHPLVDLDLMDYPHLSRHSPGWVDHLLLPPDEDLVDHLHPL
jgi:hypothetical protein